jgi:hypothetical protein
VFVGVAEALHYDTLRYVMLCCRGVMWCYVVLCGLLCYCVTIEKQIAGLEVPVQHISTVNVLETLCERANNIK